MVSVVERSSSGSFDEVIGAVETDDFGLVLGIALGIVAVALLVNFYYDDFDLESSGGGM